jgi:hypothetical protein
MSVIHFSAGSGSPPPERVAFHRTELSVILCVYGRMVAAGEWRDYALDHLKDRAIFSIFRHAAEKPVYRVVKQSKLAHRQGAYSVLGAEGQVLKRGKDLRMTLRIFDAKKSLRSVQ